ncbi:MAG: hypothetical protein CMQ20_12975 [Gammaproteobacteria bacterium]|jgi:hypothetical protein|nr:hypothetical protein [Gammaproteobacteria bacterium]|tara:strand:+ start:544 stop:831 length:288 start_codon:yes stop_codon:yes gene_type:complete
MKNMCLFLAATMAIMSASWSGADEFSKYQQILPRGQIAAVTKPHYVTAKRAVIAGDSYVLGIVVEGQARAYSLNLLNNHEVVNDQIGDLPFAAVW